MTPTRAVVQYSGGLGSWASAKLAIDLFGKENVDLLFADTLVEDEDLYRFIDETVKDFGCNFTRIADGRTPWDVFDDVKYIGNTRVDPCSLHLKRELLRKHINETQSAESTFVALGIDWTEVHRLERAEPRWLPYVVWAPLCAPPYHDKDEVLEWLKATGIKPPRLYEMGFQHNNCGGFCIKSGQAQFAQLLKQFPDRYAMNEAREERWREVNGKDVSILRDRALDKREAYAEKNDLDEVPKAVPLTMRDFRIRVDGGDRYDTDDWGGCGCAID
jgi:3'-phosphoadenosine 5'-phosphosulfate sulfotransferase (PAPS reductase)/FAD synthetase